MFTQQVELLNGLQNLPPAEFQARLLQALTSIMGTCTEPLAHRGPVSISVDGSNPSGDYTLGGQNVSAAPSIPLSEQTSVYAGLDVRNYPSIYNFGVAAPFQFGLAANFVGVVRFNAAPALNNPNGLNIAAVFNNSALMTNIFVTNIYNTNGSPYPTGASVRFTTTGANLSGATVTSYSGPPSLNPGATVTLTDPTALFGSLATGLNGIGYYNFTTTAFEAVHVDQLGLYATAVLGADLAATDATATVGSVVIQSPTSFSGSPGTLPTVADNLLGWSGKSGAKCFLARSRSSLNAHEWEIVSIPTAGSLAITNVEQRINGTDYQQRLTTGGVVGSWTTWGSGETCRNGYL